MFYTYFDATRLPLILWRPMSGGHYQFRVMIGMALSSKKRGARAGTGLGRDPPLVKKNNYLRNAFRLLCDAIPHLILARLCFFSSATCLHVLNSVFSYLKFLASCGELIFFAFGDSGNAN